MDRFLKKIICKIYCGDYFGTGFFIDKNIIITVRHVLKEYRNGHQIRISYKENFGCERCFYAEPVSPDWSRYQVIALRVKDYSCDETMRKIAKFHSFVGEQYYSFSANGAITFTLSNFDSSTRNPLILEPITGKLPDYRGSSGSPLFFHGCIVGILDEQNLFNNSPVVVRAIGIDTIIENLNKQSIKIKFEEISVDQSNALKSGKLLAYYPEEINKIVRKKHQINLDQKYIPRRYSPHDIPNKSDWGRFLYGSESSLITIFEEIENGNLLIIGDAGMGKSWEIQHLYQYLYNHVHYPVLVKLHDYVGDDLESIIYKEYFNVPDEMIVLLLDGYDELSDNMQATFKKRLRSFIEHHKEVRIVLSSRSNYCNKEIKKESTTFPGFCIYDLCALNDEYINRYLEMEGMDSTCFVERAQTRSVWDLCKNPFYFVRLVEIFKESETLPEREEVMSTIIEHQFSKDNLNQEGQLENSSSDLFSTLEDISFAMQLMQKTNLDDRDQYQKLFPLDKRDLAKKSGLLTKNGDGWQFTHNNFREYLAAKFLTRLNEDKAKNVICGNNGLKPSWVNVLGYFINLASWEVYKWLLSEYPNVLVKFELDRVSGEDRLNIFQRIFEKFENENIWISDELFDIEDLAHFSDSVECVKYLIGKIKSQLKKIPLQNAIMILGELESVHASLDEVVDCLVTIILDNNYPNYIRRKAILVFAKQKIYSIPLTERIMAAYSSSNDSYIRAGIYAYLRSANLLDEYVDYLLDGIECCYSYRSGETLANESIQLMECLKDLSSSEAVKKAMNRIVNDKQQKLYAQDKIFEKLCNKATELYNQGDLSMLDFMVDLYAIIEEQCHHGNKSICSFFQNTNTYEQALDKLLDKLSKPRNYYALLRANPMAWDYIKTCYKSDRFKNHRLFWQLVKRNVNEKEEYNALVDMIHEKSGLILPDFKEIVDYETMQIQINQDFFNSLFSREKMDRVFESVCLILGVGDFTVKELDNASEKFEEYTLEFELREELLTKLYSMDETYIIEYWKNFDWISYSQDRIVKEIERNEKLKVSNEQKSIIQGWINEWIGEGCLDKIPIITENNTIQYNKQAYYILQLLMKFDFSIKESACIELIEFPEHCYNTDHGEKIKYEFLLQRVTESTLLERVRVNLTREDLNKYVFLDHLWFCDQRKLKFGVDAAIKFCLDATNDEYHKRSALKYLFNVANEDYIISNLLPLSNKEMIIDLANLCSDRHYHAIQIKMEQLFLENPSNELLSKLIIYESTLAIQYYVEETIKTKKAIDMSTMHDGPTDCIGLIKNCEFLPELVRLMDVIFDNDFIDKEFSSVSYCLQNAIISCGKEKPGLTINEIRQHLQADNERCTSWSNYCINEIKRVQREKDDIKYTLAEAKKFIEKHAC